MSTMVRVTLRQHSSVSTVFLPLYVKTAFGSSTELKDDSLYSQFLGSQTHKVRWCNLMFSICKCKVF